MKRSRFSGWILVLVLLVVLGRAVNASGVAPAQNAAENASTQSASVGATTSDPNATIIAPSCEQGDVTTAYDSASPGDTIVVPAGNCTWASTLSIAKNNIALQGDGMDQTYLRHGTFAGPLVQIEADGVRITGFTFDGDYQNTTNRGGIRVGTNAVDPSYEYGDFRIDHCRFIEYDNAGNIGWSAIVVRGFVYGVIDHNVFEDCTGECIDICADGVPALQRSQEYGQYTNGTIYIEDNIWNYYHTGYNAENALDGNSGSRWVVRYNTFHIGPSSRVLTLICNHETCVTCSGGSGDVGSLVMEIYGNKIYNHGSGLSTANRFVTQRGGRSLIYNNTVYENDTYWDNILNLRNYRSFDYACPQYCGLCNRATHGRGYSTWCHDADPGYMTEGRVFSKTTLAEDLDASETSIDVADVADFPTYGGSIMVGSEQIDYAGITGTTLTGCTRGANGTTNTTHGTGADVDLFVFGQCLEQINTTYIWGNKTVGDVDKNDVTVFEGGAYGEHNDYSVYDIKSYAERPDNWQYRNDGTAYSYVPYPYPHPLTREAPPLILQGSPDDEAIYLSWRVNTPLPPTTTWQIDYEGPIGDQPPPITGIVSPTRSYTLTGLTNYAWYTVTLDAMLGSTPSLTDTVRVMPTDIAIYLPLVWKMR